MRQRRASCFTASFIPTPNIKIGIINGMINTGSKAFPLLAPNTKAAPMMPIKDMLNPSDRHA